MLAVVITKRFHFPLSLANRSNCSHVCLIDMVGSISLTQLLLGLPFVSWPQQIFTKRNIRNLREFVKPRLSCIIELKRTNPPLLFIYRHSILAATTQDTGIISGTFALATVSPLMAE